MGIETSISSAILRASPSLVAGSSGVGLTLPRTGLLLHARSYDPDAALILDRVGDSTRTIQPLQYMDCDGTGYFASAEILGTETVTSSEGTSTPSISAGKLEATAGTLWSVVLSNGSRYEFATKTGATSAVAFDVSGHGRHLTATGFADVDALCATSLTTGSDWLNQMGFTVAPDGGYVDTDLLIPITEAVVVPIDAGGLSNIYMVA